MLHRTWHHVPGALKDPAALMSWNALNDILATHYARHSPFSLPPRAARPRSSSRLNSFSPLPAAITRTSFPLSGN